MKCFFLSSAALIALAAPAAAQALGDEDVVVSATRIPTPLQPDRQQRHGDHGAPDRGPPGPLAARCAARSARPFHHPDRRGRRPDLHLHARHQFQPHQGAAGRHRSCRSLHAQRRGRYLQAPGRRHRPGGSAARAARRALWLRRHRRGDQHHHQDRRGADEDHRRCGRRQLRHLQPARRRFRLGRRLSLCRHACSISMPAPRR